jgi:hypothetical protein
MKDDIVVTFKCSRVLAEAAEAIAAMEGVSRSDVARRALMRDLAGFWQARPESSTA